MAVSRPDGENFNRLLISLGVAAIATGVTAPWLLLREDRALLLSQSELEGLSPTAAAVIRDRQDLIQRLQSVSPWFTAGMVLIGLGLLCWGARRLYLRQKVDDDMAATQLDIAKQQARIQPQSIDVATARREEEAEAEIDAEMVLESLPVESAITNAPTKEAVSRRLGQVRSEFVERAVHAEYHVMQAIARAADAGTTFALQPEIFNPAGGPPLRSDAMITTGNGAQVLVEVKLLRPLTAIKNLTNRVREFAGAVAVAQDLLGSPVNGLLVLVVDQPQGAGPEVAATDVAERGTQLAPHGIQVVAVDFGDLERWSPPLGPPITSSSA